MILIVDSGSTKSDWIAVDNNGNKLLEKMRTKGLNPAILTEKKLKKIIKNNKDLKSNREKVTHGEQESGYRESTHEEKERHNMQRLARDQERPRSTQCAV